VGSVRLRIIEGYVFYPSTSAAGAPGIPGLVALRAARRPLRRLGVRAGRLPTASSRELPVPLSVDRLGTWVAVIAPYCRAP
jgi:hypothetical protein